MANGGRVIKDLNEPNQHCPFYRSCLTRFYNPETHEISLPPQGDEAVACTCRNDDFRQSSDFMRGKFYVPLCFLLLSIFILTFFIFSRI